MLCVENENTLRTSGSAFYKMPGTVGFLALQKVEISSIITWFRHFAPFWAVLALEDTDIRIWALHTSS